MSWKPLRGEYYAECNAVFRRATNQGALMMQAFLRQVAGRGQLQLLSVGAGMGLFEIEALQRLKHRVQRFVGVDVDQHACEVLERNLARTYPTGLEWQVYNQSFQQFDAEQLFDLVLFNHAFEYLDGDRAVWITKSVDLLAEDGQLMIFSPNRGGINQIYQEVADPVFSDDLLPLLEGLPYSSEVIEADCDLSLMDQLPDHSDGTKLLSFLTQADCRDLPAGRREELVRYFRSLRQPGKTTIPHPTTLFVIQR